MAYIFNRCTLRYYPLLSHGEGELPSILSRLGLVGILQRFIDERMDCPVIMTATDQDLIRLGVNTIGDRVRLREACRRRYHYSSSQGPGSSASTTGSSLSSTVRDERSRLFSPRPSTSLGSRRRGNTSSASTRINNKKKAGARTWTATFVCLANRNSTKVPSATEKNILHKAGLGIKRIKLGSEDTEE